MVRKAQQTPLDNWEIEIVLPNLHLSQTFEVPHIALVPADLARMHCTRSPPAGTRKLLDGFTDASGEQFEPPVPITTRHGPPQAR